MISFYLKIESSVSTVPSHRKAGRFLGSRADMIFIDVFDDILNGAIQKFVEVVEGSGADGTIVPQSGYGGEDAAFDSRNPEIILRCC